MAREEKQPLSREQKRKRRGRRFLRVLIVVIGVILIINFSLEYILLKVVNKKLQELDGYEGHVEDIDLHLWRGAYQIEGIEINKTGGKIPFPFFSADVIDLSVEWSAIFKGEIVGEIVAEHPVVNFVKGPTPETSQTKAGKDWTQVVDDLMPLTINRFEILNGQVTYRDFHSSPKVDLLMKDIHVLAENLSNVNENQDLLPGTVTATANTYGGNVKLNMKLDALNKIPTFDMNAELKDLNLVQLNDFLKAYGKFDVQKGTFSVYTEAAARNNKITGYAKPVIKDLDVVEWKDEKEDPLGQKILETLIGFGGWIFKNKTEDQVATEIDFEGSLDNPEISIWEIVGEALRNAFIQALYPSIENSINIAKVGENPDDEEGFFEGLFKKDNNQKDDKEKKKDKKDKEN
jgi:hypothetical protein